MKKLWEKIKGVWKWIFGVLGIGAVAVALTIPQYGIIENSLQNKYDSAIQIKQKYELQNGELVIRPKDKNDTQIVVGKKKVADGAVEKIVPSVEMSRWAGEVSVFYQPMNLDTNAVISFENEKIIISSPDVVYKLYEISDTVMDKGGFEFEVVLLQKPVSNVMKFTLESKNLNFYYQGVLTEWEKANGFKRPDEIVGTYSVYHSSKKGNYSKLGGMNYTTGKFGHIYKPKITDSVGNWVWGVLHIENGILSVTIPQSFLDTATYPIYHAAGLTFGYTTVGATTGEIAANTIAGMKGTPTSSGTVDSLQVYGKASSGTINIKGVLVDTDKVILTNGITPAINLDTTAGWEVANYTTSPSVTGSSDYWVMFIPDGLFTFNNDSNTPGGQWYDGSNSYATPTNPTDGAAYNFDLSMYATYTATAASGVKKQSEIWFD